MKHDEWALTKELGKLREYGFLLQAERSDKTRANDRYNIIFQNSREILEPYCSIEEVVGIANSLNICFSKLVNYNKSRKTYEQKRDNNNCSSVNND